MDRREFVAYGSAAALAAILIKTQVDQVAEAQTSHDLELHLEEIFEEMIDGEVLFAHAFRDPLTRLIRPQVFVQQGATIRIKLVNRTTRPRRFALTGTADDRFPMMQPGATSTIAFVAPMAGSYIYHENSLGAVGRLAGFYGAFVVLPTDGRTAAGTQTPYARRHMRRQRSSTRWGEVRIFLASHGRCTTRSAQSAGCSRKCCPTSTRLSSATRR